LAAERPRALITYDGLPISAGGARRPVAPVRLSKKHWSRWQLNAQGTRYYNRRISVLDGE